MTASGTPVATATAVAWSGALTAALLRETASRFMRPLVYLALLFFGLIAIFDILPESKTALSWPLFIAAVTAGYVAFWLICKYVAPIFPACAIRSFENAHQHPHGVSPVVLSGVLASHRVFHSV